MFKTIPIIVMATLCLNFSLTAQEPIKPPPLKNQALMGKVISAATGETLPGAIIKITTTNQIIPTNDKGEFILTLSNGSYNLSVSSIGYKAKNVPIQVPLKDRLVITLDATSDLPIKTTEELLIHSKTINPLKIGDTIPETVWNLPLQIRNHPTGKQSTTLKEYKGKLIILDFWATWCSPCLAMLPKTNTLQQQYEGQVQFLPITYESESKINEMIESTGWNPMQKLPHIIADTLLNKVFPHQGIPHYVWINSSGIVQAITGTKEVNNSIIIEMLSNLNQKLSEKNDEAGKVFNSSNSLLSNQSLKESNLIFSATLGPYRPGFATTINYGIGPYKDRRLLAVNNKIFNLFRLAYASPENIKKKIHFGYPLNRTIVKVKDPQYWLKSENYFCYEQLMLRQDDDCMRKIMRQQLEMLLPIKGRLEMKEMPCYLLSYTGQSTKNLNPIDTVLTHSPIHLVFHNQSFQDFVEVLNLYLGFKQKIIVDNTGLKEMFSIELKTQLTDLTSVQMALKPWGFTLKAATKTVEVLVITDKK